MTDKAFLLFVLIPWFIGLLFGIRIGYRIRKRREDPSAVKRVFEKWMREGPEALNAREIKLLRPQYPILWRHDPDAPHIHLSKEDQKRIINTLKGMGK